MSTDVYRTDDFRFGDLTLAFAANDSRSNHLICQLALSCHDEFQFQQCFGIYAYDVDRFLVELDRLHGTLEGAAELSEAYDNSTRIVFSVTDSGRGAIVVSGDLVSSLNRELRRSQLGGILPYDGIRLQFDGCQTDQSYIPRFVRRIRDFFREADVDVSCYY